MSGPAVRAARRSQAKPLIGLYSKSGAGKTLSSLFLARGFVGREGRIGMIESESGRGEAHADTVIGHSYVGGFDVIPIWDHDSDACPAHSSHRDPGPCNCTHKGLPFTPTRYGACIAAAERSRWDALIVDSASHEWEGVGGVLHWAAENQASGKKGQLVWQQPKIDHERHFVGKLLQCAIPLVIVNMRAKYPMEEVVNDKGKKEWQRATELIPKQSEDILFEMFVHGYFEQGSNNFAGTKYTRPELAGVLRTGEPFTNATGAALARWSRGEPVGTLLDVVAQFKAATSIKELQAAGAAAKWLGDDDRTLAKAEYEKRLAELKAPVSEPGTPQDTPH